MHFTGVNIFVNTKPFYSIYVWMTFKFCKRGGNIEITPLNMNMHCCGLRLLCFSGQSYSIEWIYTSFRYNHLSPSSPVTWHTIHISWSALEDSHLRNAAHIHNNPLIRTKATADIKSTEDVFWGGSMALRGTNYFPRLTNVFKRNKSVNLFFRVFFF